MNSEITKGKKLLKLATPLAVGFSIFLILAGIGSMISIFIDGVQFTKTITTGYGTTEVTINTAMGIILIVVVLLIQPIPTTANQLRCANKLLIEQGHNYEQIVFGLRVFAKKGGYIMSKKSPHVALWNVRCNIFIFVIISAFLALLCCLAIFTSLYSSEQLLRENASLLVAACVFNIFNPGHILALLAYNYLYGNEIKRRKRNTMTNQIRQERDSQTRLSNEQECSALLKVCGMAFYIKYHDQLMKVNDVDLIDIITENYPYEAKLSRIQAAKQIFAKELDTLALNKIASANEIISQEVIEQARKILSSMPKGQC